MGMQWPEAEPGKMLCMAHFRMFWFLADGLQVPDKVIIDMTMSNNQRIGSNPAHLMG